MPDARTMIMIEGCKRHICRNASSKQVTNVLPSLLVPLMIALFTIVTTVLQMNLAKQQRE